MGKKGYELRYNLAKEELDEYLEACQNKDLVGVADALTDQLYVLLGTFLRHGMQDIAENLFNEVHRSNMTKLDKNGKIVRRKDGKITKSELFEKPKLKEIIYFSDL